MITAWSEIKYLTTKSSCFVTSPHHIQIKLFFKTFSIQQILVNTICHRLDLNCRSLVSETTALPTEPQLLPRIETVYISLAKIMQEMTSLTAI